MKSIIKTKTALSFSQLHLLRWGFWHTAVFFLCMHTHKLDSTIHHRCSTAPIYVIGFNPLKSTQRPVLLKDRHYLSFPLKGLLMLRSGSWHSTWETCIIDGCLERFWQPAQLSDLSSRGQWITPGYLTYMTLFSTHQRLLTDSYYVKKIPLVIVHHFMAS